jgi:hypothetical protein
MRHRIIRAVIAISVAVCAGTAVLAADSGSKASTSVDAQGNLRVPQDYRTTYEFMGSWSVAGDSGAGAKQIHQSYASPGAVAAYQKTGKWPEGAVLVKEVYDTTTADMTTGTVSHVQKLEGWFVMVKATANPHPGSKLWGDGWGWSWFDAGNMTKTTSTDYKTDCLSCHVPAQKTDWIYVDGYARLKR